MDFFDLLFGGGQAIQGIFRLGFIPKEDDFREFSGEEYQKFKEKECDILGGVEIIDSLCEEKTFISDDAKLRFVATVLPGVFSEGTKYACKQE